MPISAGCKSSALVPSEQGFIDKASMSSDNRSVVNFIRYCKINALSLKYNSIVTFFKATF